jgi:hypothetical protein
LLDLFAQELRRPTPKDRLKDTFALHLSSAQNLLRNRFPPSSMVISDDQIFCRVAQAKMCSVAGKGGKAGCSI